MLISEFLPNPEGKDTAGEFIELLNNGAQPVLLTGWKIKDASGKTFTIKNVTLGPGEYKSFPYSATKITINNDKETLSLYDASEALIHTAHFNASEHHLRVGESMIVGGKGFTFTNHPTPGARNIAGDRIVEEPSAKGLQELVAEHASSLQGNTSVVSTHGNEIVILAIMISVGLVCAWIYMIISKQLSHS